MNNFTQAIFKFLNTRLLLRAIVWFCVCYLVFGSNKPENPDYYFLTYFFKAISVLSLMVFTYVNNLYFVPAFLAKKKYKIYFPLAIFWALLYSFTYAAFVKSVIHFYPAIKHYEIVFLSVPVDADLSLSSMVDPFVGYATVWSLWLFVSTLTWYMHDYRRQQELIRDAQQKQLETELNFLKNQINPHFFFNTLNNLYALSLQKSDQAPDMILKLSSILRYILYESDTPTVSFEKEKEIMQAYVELEKLRLSDKDQLHFNISTDKSYNLPPLLWLPVLENVFKHGTRTMSEKNPVEFKFEIRNNRLSVYSKNNEKMLIDSGEQPGGVGLNNLRKRLELLFPDKHTFETRSENNQYITQLQIDLS